MAAKFAEKVVFALLDSGSEACLITQGLVNELELNQLVASTNKHKIVCADNHISQSIGTITASLQIADCEVQITCLVLPQNESQFTLGWNFMQHLGFAIDSTLKTLQRNGSAKKIPLLKIISPGEAPIMLNHMQAGFTSISDDVQWRALPNPLNDNFKCSFISEEKVTIQPKSTTFIKVSSTYEGSAILLVTKPEVKFDQATALPVNIRIAELLVTSDIKTLPITNYGHEAINISKEEIIATATKDEILGALRKRAKRTDVVRSATVQVTDLNEPSNLEDFPWDKIDLGQLDPEWRKNFIKLIRKYKKQYVWDRSQMRPAKVPPLDIELKEDAHPRAQQPYRRSPVEHELIGKIVRELREANLIEDSNSEWASPIHLVKKKDGSIRPVVDYRRVNEVIKDMAYPMPRIDDCIDALHGAIWFCVIDLFSGFWQVPVAKRARKYLAVCTRQDLFQWRVAPFGIKCIPQFFSNMMNHILRHLLWEGVLCYIDDVVIYAGTQKELYERFEEVLKLFELHDLQINLNKSRHGLTRLEFAGQVVSNGKVYPDPKRVDAIDRMVAPSNISELRSLLGSLGYVTKHIESFAKHAAPLHQLLRKNVEWQWGEDQQKAFDHFKQCLKNEPVLNIYRPDYYTVILTDASAYAIGAVLKQRPTENDRESEVTCGYYSKTLNKPQKNYCATDRECLAIYEAIKNFYPYLHGRQYTIITDHCALKYLMKAKLCSDRLLRYALLLQAQDFKIEHQSGKLHCEPDCLSRLLPKFMEEMKIKDTAVDLLDNELATCSVRVTIQNNSNTVKKKREKIESDQQFQVRMDLIQTAQLADPFIIYIRSVLESTTLQPSDANLLDSYVMINNRVYRRVQKEFADPGSSTKLVTKDSYRLVVPRALRLELLNAYHDINGHPGQKVTTSDLRLRYFWPNMEMDVIDYVRSCTTCNQIKANHTGPAPATSINKNIDAEDLIEPFTRVAIDVVHVTTGPGKTKYIVTCTCLTTKYCVAESFNNQLASTIVKFLERRIFLIFGTPRFITSDNGTNFRSSLYASVLKELGVRRLYTSGYHPQANSQVERLQGTIKQVLRLIVNDQEKSWEKLLPYAVWAYNTHVHSVTGYSPYYLVYGHHPKQVIDLKYEFEPPVNSASKSTEVAQEMRLARETAIKRIKKIGQETERKLNKTRKPTVYAAGEEVLVLKPIKPPGTCTFDWTPYEEGYTVLRQCQPNNYVLTHKSWKPGQSQIFHADRLRRSHVRSSAPTPRIKIPQELVNALTESSKLCDASIKGIEETNESSAKNAMQSESEVTKVKTRAKPNSSAERIPTQVTGIANDRPKRTSKLPSKFKDFCL